MRKGWKIVKKAIAIMLLAASFGLVLVFARSVQQHQLQEKQINEASGLAASRNTPGILYTHNDSGGENAVFVLNSLGMMPARILLDGIKNRDWEDIAVGPDPATGKSCVYVGEIGDNGARYKSVFVYRFPEPELADTLITVRDVATIEIVYEDGARDAEALFVDPSNGDIIIISKREKEVGVYRVAYPYRTDAVNTAKRIGALPLSMVTAADISPNGKQILIKTYSAVYRLKRSLKKPLESALKARLKPMPYTLEPQGESIAWDTKGKGYYTLSESGGSTAPQLYYYK